MTNDNDLILRGAVLDAMCKGPRTVQERLDIIRAIPAVAASHTADPVANADSRQRVTVKPLVFDDLGIASDDLLNVIIVYRNPADQDRHNAERAARILAAIDVPTAPRDAQIAALVEALRDAAKQHRIIAGMDMLAASSVAYNAARAAEAAIAAVKGGDA